MKQNYLHMIVFFLSAMVLVWTYFQFSNASNELSETIAIRSANKTLINEIQVLKDAAGSAVQIAPAKYDPTTDIIAKIREAGIKLPAGFSTSQSRLRKFESTQISEWKFDLPKLTCSAAQVERFTRLVANSEFESSVNSISLTAKSDSSKQELWDALFDVRFLKIVK